MIFLGQYGGVVGDAAGLDANKLVKAVDITLNISQWDPATTVLGLSSIVVLRTDAGALSKTHHGCRHGTCRQYRERAEGELPAGRVCSPVC